MFLMREILMATPLIVYAGVRIVTLFKNRLFKLLFALFYLGLMAAFPAAETLAHRSGGALAQAAMAAGYTALPVLLYIVLFVVLLDLSIGLLRLAKILSRETVRGDRFRRWRLAASLLVPAAIIVFGIVNERTLRVKSYAVEVPRLSSSLTHLRIAFASDFHLRAMTPDRFMDRFAARTNALKPDLVLIGGDVNEGDRQDETTEAFEAAFRSLKAKYGVFGVPGNHERYGGDRFDFFTRAGIRLLQDEVLRIDDAFYLAGRKDAWTHSRPRSGSDGSRGRLSAGDLLKDTPHDLPVILMDHNPSDMEAISHTIADIQLSGHTHMGQLFPVSLIAMDRYELTWGYKKKGNTHVFVTSGVQLWGPPVRTAGRSEIVLIDVAFK